jgi:hypothetical protein
MMAVADRRQTSNGILQDAKQEDGHAEYKRRFLRIEHLACEALFQDPIGKRKQCFQTKNETTGIRNERGMGVWGYVTPPGVWGTDKKRMGGYQPR